MKANDQVVNKMLISSRNAPRGQTRIRMLPHGNGLAAAVQRVRQIDLGAVVLFDY
jgi:hypothetical protein